jgi:hypothetical protein
MLKMSWNIWKGIGPMWSTCIKFEQRTGWKPMVRKAETMEEIVEVVNKAFDDYDVHHACVFLDGVFMHYYKEAPYVIAVRRKLWRSKFYGKAMNRSF